MGFLIARVAAAILIGGLAAVMALVVIDLDREAPSLAGAVFERLPETGVRQPVTAVLLSFRAYDTWLEVVVLLVAIAGVLTLQRSAGLTHLPRVDVEHGLPTAVATMLAPVIIVSAAYLLWLGTHSAGGAFQAGAVLAAAGVLLRMSGYSLAGVLRSLPLRLLAGAGTAAFLVIGTWTVAAGGQLMEYRGRVGARAIVTVETAITVAVAATLLALFVGARPWRRSARAAGQ